MHTAATQPESLFPMATTTASTDARGATVHNATGDDAAGSTDTRGDQATPFKLMRLKTYVGGKGADGTYQRLINEIPPHRTFISAFLGNCAIMRHKRPARENIGLELDPAIADVWHTEAPAWCDVRNTDAYHYLERCELDRSAFLFCDPPYVNETLSRNGHYRFNFTTEQHERLLVLLNAMRCNIMLCSLPNLLYEHHLKGWRTFQYENKTRNGMQTEQVWMNYREPKRLHDYRYIGSDYRERERIRKLMRRRVRLLNEMPLLERHALLAYLKENIAQ